MDITFDRQKNHTNFEKHGVWLNAADLIDWSSVMAYVDTRNDYREVREIGFAVINSRLYCVVFTQRGDTMHIISLRKANKREVKSYVEQT